MVFILTMSVMSALSHSDALWFISTLEETNKQKKNVLKLFIASSVKWR